jgi:hypothetical protein
MKQGDMASGSRALPIVIAVLAAAFVAWYGYQKFTASLPWAKTAGDVRTGPGSEIIVMRTKGGLLEVATIRATEQLDKKFTYTVLGMKVGETMPHIRVPAVYRYHIDLAPEWTIVRTDKVFTVVTPAVKPSLPVAVDLAHLEKDVGGTWILIPFNEHDDLDSLEREITATLARKAGSSAYLQLQREAARKTVTEFVKKWLVTQVQWQTGSTSEIRVLFPDEPISSFGPVAFPQLRRQPVSQSE